VDAERYDRTRPRYPDALITAIATASPGPEVLDVGCGTGIAARQFQAAGCKVLGVEPDVRMAAWARERGLDVEVARFETWNPANRQFDAVIAGTAWHWVDPLAGAANAARVLRPGGLLAPFHHVFQLPPALADASVAVYQRVMADSPLTAQATTDALQAYQPLLAKIADGIREVGGFSEPEHWRFDWERSYSREQWLDQLPTLGSLTPLPSEQQAQILEGVGDAIDAVGGSFTMSYATIAITAIRTVG
jgi:SAM-dependent methyltransferase